jgi:hypothetical protein
MPTADSECRQAATQIIVENVTTLAKVSQQIDRKTRIYTIKYYI